MHGGRIHRTRQTITRRACALAGVSILASMAAVPALGQTAEAQQQAPSSSAAPAERAIDVSLPLVLDGTYIGDVGARTTTGGTLVSLAGQRLLELLGPRLNDETRAELAARIAAEGDFLPLAQAQVQGLSVSFDAANFAVAVSIAVSSTKTQDFALSPNMIDTPRDGTFMPADLAVGLNMFFSKSYLHRDRIAPQREGWQPTTLGIDGVVNVGGLGGAYLFHQWTYRRGDEGRLTRGNVTLVRDDWRRAVRVQALDVDPFILPLQGAAPLGGIAVLRAYADLQPNRAFGRINAGVLYEGQSDQFRGTDHRMFLNVSWRLGPRSGMNARYESGSNRYRVEYERVLTNEVGSLGYRAGVSGGDGERGFQGQVDYFANRGEVGARFDLFDDTVSGGRVRQSTVRAAVGVGMADGTVAVGRPYREGFAVVSRHKSLDGKPVDVSIGGVGQTYARIDGLGPVLVTANRPYQRNLVSVNVADLPTGYDIGAGAFELYPGSGSGFKLMVGSDASNTVMGVLLGRDGEPVSLQVGKLVPLDRPGTQAISLFTNRAGRFAATGLKPGLYRLTLNGNEDSALEIRIPADSTGLVSLGTVQLEGAQR